MSPSCTFVSAWSWFIMFFDLIYTAFLVPVSVGFKTDNMSGQTTSGSIVKWIDFVAGCLFIDNFIKSCMRLAGILIYSAFNVHQRCAQLSHTGPHNLIVWC